MCYNYIVLQAGLQPPGRDHRLVMAHLSTGVGHDPNLKHPTSQPTGVAMGSAEHPFPKDNRLQKGDDLVSSTAPLAMLNQAHSGSMHFMQQDKPAALTLNATAAATVLSAAASHASLISSISSNPMKKEASLYSYQTGPVCPPNSASMQGFNNDKKTMKKELENRKNVHDKVLLSSSDISQFLSSQMVPVDDIRLKTTALEKNSSGDKSRSMASTGVSTGVGHHSQSPKLQKLERHDPVNAATAKNSIHPSIVSGCTSEERRFDGAMNYVVAATAAKGQILVPVHPASVGRTVLPNGQSKVNMPILKESLAAKPLSTGPMMGGGLGLVAGRVGQIPTMHPVSSVVAATDPTLNGLLLSLPISSSAAAAAVSSGSLSLPLNSSFSLAASLSSAAGTIASSTMASYPSLSSWPQIPLKRDYTMAYDARDHLSSDPFPGDNAKRMRIDHGMTRNQSPDVGAVFCSMSGTSSATTTTTCFSTSVCPSSKMTRTCNDYLQTCAEAKDYSSKTLGPVTGNHLAVPAECDRGSVIVGQKALEEFRLQQLPRISHYIAQEENCHVQDLKLTSSTAAVTSCVSARLQDYLGQPMNSEANHGADSDTLSANSPVPPLSSMLSASSAAAAAAPAAKPVCSEPVPLKQWQHTKFKKALLQRYSDEDLKNTPEGTQDGGDNGRKLENGNVTMNNSALLEEREDNNSSVGMNNDTMSAASEQESTGWISASDSVVSAAVDANGLLVTIISCVRKERSRDYRQRQRFPHGSRSLMTLFPVSWQGFELVLP